MKYINQFGILLAFWLFGEIISHLIAQMINIPGSIVGMLLLVLALITGVLKESQIQDIGDLLLNNIAFFFVPVSVGLLLIKGVYGTELISIIFIGIVSTIITMLATMLVTHLLTKERS